MPVLVDLYLNVAGFLARIRHLLYFQRQKSSWGPLSLWIPVIEQAVSRGPSSCCPAGTPNGCPLETCRVPALFQPATAQFSERWRAIANTHLGGKYSEESNAVLFSHPLIKKLMYKDSAGFLLKWICSGCLEKKSCNGLGGAGRKEKDVFRIQAWVWEGPTPGSLCVNWVLWTSVSLSGKWGGAPALTPLPG